MNLIFETKLAKKSQILFSKLSAINIFVLTILLSSLLLSSCNENTAIDKVKEYKRAVERLKADNPQWSGTYSFYFSAQGIPVGLDLRNKEVNEEGGVTEITVFKSSLNNISSLETLEMSKLNLSHTEVEDISPLRGKALVYLDIASTPISNISVLRNMPLSVLHMNGTKVRNIQSLSGMHLKTLLMGGTQVDDLSPLVGIDLDFLDISRTPAAETPKGLSVRHLKK